MRILIYVALAIGVAFGAFAAIYMRQPTGFALMGASVLAFAYVAIRGK